MTRSRLLGLGALILGALITLYTISTDGPTLSFILVLGLLLIVDGVLRLTIDEPGA